MRKALGVHGAASLLLLAVGCGSVIDEGPTNDDIKNTTGLTVEQAARVVYDNLNLVWPNPVEPRLDQVGKIGCRTNPNSMRSEGPPWQVEKKMVKQDPSPELVEQVRANLDSLTERGFGLEESAITDDHPLDRVYTDGNGYVIQSSMEIDRRVTDIPILEVASRAPCAAE
ncbi:hypothetical protein [Nocardia cyriacigeorgica]|uniref:hypothetical protein n=1 Tax=Nocardia cyriacigeorgica TaxID=135487 RepID=UPI001032B858|nr:hypothetical protein [Nocardia cyriacigeorgica]